MINKKGIINLIYKLNKKNFKMKLKYLKTYQQLHESKKTEAEGLNILKTKTTITNPEEVINKLREIDNSDNQRNIPFMSVCYIQGMVNYMTLKSIFDEYTDLEKRKLIKPISIDKSNGYKLKIENRVFDGFISFSEYVHGKLPAAKPNINKEELSSDSEEKPMWEGNGIFIYDVPDFETSIRYTQGALTGKKYSFCIGDPEHRYYQQYRNDNISTFYFIIDKNRDLNDPLHVVVYDAREDDVKLTDADNRTGNIAEFGDNVEEYQEYLESKGVPYDKILVNRPKTEQEIYEDELLGQRNEDLNWFIALPVEMKSKYVGRRYLLTDEQFDYLLE